MKKSRYQLTPKEVRFYKREESCIFKKNNERFGALSNMASGFPLVINGIQIRTTEALYQACRFPHLPDIQKEIISQNSPMRVKMISNGKSKMSRDDWENVRLKIMKWCVNIKLAQNFIQFGAALHETGLKNIVENSSNDNFWGAIPNEDETIFIGKNALGRILMELRQVFYGVNPYSLLLVHPPQIDNFLLFTKPIDVIDERQRFIKYLLNHWKDEENIQKTDNENIIKQGGKGLLFQREIIQYKVTIKKKNNQDDEPSLFDDI